MPTKPFDKIDFQGIHPADSINKIYLEMVPSVWNIWHGQEKAPIDGLRRFYLSHPHMDLLKSMGTHLSHSIWHSARDNANCTSKHLFTFLMPFSSQGKAPHFLSYVFKWKVTLQPRLDAWDKLSDLVHWENLGGAGGEGGGRGDRDGEHM